MDVEVKAQGNTCGVVRVSKVKSYERDVVDARGSEDWREGCERSNLSSTNCRVIHGILEYLYRSMT